VSLEQGTFWPMHSTTELPVSHVLNASLSLTNAHTHMYTQGACFSRIAPTPVKNPTLVGHSPNALSLLGIFPEEVARPEFVEYFCGNKIMPGSEPASHCYCGHQFGHFSGQLGDWVCTVSDRAIR